MKMENIFTQMTLQIQKALSILQTIRSRVSRTEQVTEEIGKQVKDLQPLLGLLTTPDQQELEMGNGLEKALVRMIEQLEQMGFLISQQIVAQTALVQRMKAMEQLQIQVLEKLERMDATKSMNNNLMDKLDQIQRELQNLSTELFDDEDPAQQ